MRCITYKFCPVTTETSVTACAMRILCLELVQTLFYFFSLLVSLLYTTLLNGQIAQPIISAWSRKHGYEVNRTKEVEAIISAN
jgi:hypothetical protein